MPRQTNTKEKIISSAFLLYRDMLFNEFSLSDVAKASGISKTAIFRHFTNKSELVQTMNERFFDGFESLVKTIEAECGENSLGATRRAVDCVFEFDAEHPGYLEYYLMSLMGTSANSERMMEMVTSNNLRLPSEKTFKDKKAHLPKNLLPLYIEITILNFLIEGSRAVAAGVIKEKDESFRNRVASIIFDGLGKKQNPIPEKRRKELDILCKVKLNSDELHDRFLEAFIAAVNKNGGFNFTVEDIANELGMAKSSMYAFFENKVDYMKNMFRQETEFFGEILQEKCTAVANIDEMIYVMMRASANYFMERPQVVFMHLFFTFNNIKVFEGALSGNSKYLDKAFPLDFEFEFGDAKGIFIKWVSVLSVTFTFMGRKNNFPPAWIDFFVSTVFEFIECGTRQLITNNE